jgi:hypothetical protein
MNAWPRNDTGNLWDHFAGRGDPPAFWVEPLPDDPGIFFAFDPMNPDGTGPLRTGDYVLMRGTLWQDHVHYGSATDPPTPWDSGQFAGQGGWLEMHPPDWVVRVGAAPGPNTRQTFRFVALMTADRTGAGSSLADRIDPDFGPSSASRYLEVRSVRVETDPRFTLDASVRALQGIDRTDHVDIVATTSPTGFEKGRLKASWLVSWRELDRQDQAWVDDAVPAGAVLHADQDAWDWTSDAPGAFHGARFHRSASIAQDWHQHYFDSATDTLVVGPDDVLFAMVYLDPDTPPDQVMLQWRSGNWEHRAYWGENLVPWGVDGTASRRRMGPLPRSGEWVRLEVPALQVGLAGTVVDGMAFTLWGGQASWDYAGKRVVPLALHVLADPDSVELTGDVVVRATDAATGDEVDGTVSIGGHVVARTNQPYLIRPGHPVPRRIVLVVDCPGYPQAQATVTVTRPDV